MKNSLLAFLFFLIISSPAVNSQTVSCEKDPAGNWKFEAPYAPEGYKSGSITISLVEQKYSASMSFAGNEYKFQGEKFRIEKDSLFFSVYLENQYVAVSLKMEDRANISGKAVYSEGVVPLVMTRREEIKN